MPLGNVQILRGDQPCTSSEERAGGNSLRFARGESPCFPGQAMGVSRNEAQQIHGVMCVCAQGMGQQVVAVGRVLSTSCLKVSGLCYPNPLPQL